MRFTSALLLFTLLISLQHLFAQEHSVDHNFKISGLTSIANLTSSVSTKMVEYDPQSPDHLYVSLVDANEKIVTKTRFLFTTKKFELIHATDYLISDDLILDGSHVSFFENGSIDKELIYKNGTLKQETEFYPNGERKSVVSGDDQVKNGVYQMWHLNGQLSFRGEYSNNLKNGEFQQFDESGNLMKKGTYRYGKLVSGEPVVQDIIYKVPEIKAECSKEKESINKELKLRFDELKKPKSFPRQKVKLNLIIDKTGRVIEVRKGTVVDSLLLSVFNKLLKDIVVFFPAKVENTPVDSELIIEFQWSSHGLVMLEEEPLKSLNAKAKPASQNEVNGYVVVDQMPEYPGGQEGLRNFLARNVRYPIEALQRGIQGRVYVNFVIDENGDVTNIKIARGVHKSLDQEAVRVVKLMPKWTPGMQDGKPVKVSYTAPISFKQEIINTRSNWNQ